MARHDEPPEHRLTEAAQAYLLSLRSMTGSSAKPTVTALARRMDVSTQAAAEMVGRLTSEGLVEVGADRALTLTAAGRNAADAIFRRHSLLEWLLTKVVGLGWAESDEEAMRIQASISPRVEARLAELLGNPPTCPHGNPIDAQAARSRPPGVLLSEITAGSEVTLYRITEEAEEDVELLSYLEHQQLVPGTVARVTDVSASRDSITIEGPIGLSTMGLRPAALIRVLPGRADPSLFHRVPELRSVD